jgi:hypothetical protein
MSPEYRPPGPRERGGRQLLALTTGASLAGLVYWAMKASGRDEFRTEFGFLGVTALALGVLLVVASRVVKRHEHGLELAAGLLISYFLGAFLALKVP